MKTHSKLVLGVTLIAFTLVALELVAFGSGASANKKLDRAMQSYTKKIERAEQKSCNTDLGKSPQALSRSCARDLKALDKQYDRYSDEIKSDPQMASLHERHEELRKLIPVLEHQAAIDKVARKYRMKIEIMEKKTCPKKESYGSGESAVCLEDVLKADKLKEGIPGDMLDEPVIKDLIGRHEELRKMPEHMEQVYGDNNSKFLERGSLIGEFSDTVHDISYYHYLENGKANKPADIGYVEGLKDDLPRIKQLAADCKGKFAEIIQDNPQRQAQCELAENADKYYAQFAAASYKVFLQEEIKEVNAVVSRLEDPKDRYIELSDYNRLVVGGKEYVGDLKKRVGESHKKAGLPEPSYAELEAAVAKLPGAIKAAAKANRWADKKTVDVTRAIEKRTAQVVDKMGMKLVKVGRLDEPWTLVKNQLGIPLYKGTKGWVMMKNPKESFCRMQYASFTRTYDGAGYAPASDVGIVSAIVPTSCR